MSEFSDDLGCLSSAEDFFAYFHIETDPTVVAVNRLHILKRFHDYLARIDGLDIEEDDVRRAAYREALARAYGDFIASSAGAEKVFPIFQRGKNAFVALSSIRSVARDDGRAR
jgi:nitrogenase-stabilizing/protective protein